MFILLEWKKLKLTSLNWLKWPEINIIFVACLAVEQTTEINFKNLMYLRGKSGTFKPGWLKKMCNYVLKTHRGIKVGSVLMYNAFKDIQYED